MREFVFMIKRSDHKYSTHCIESVIEVRPRQASVLACVVLARTSERLTGEGACCRCYDIE